MREEQRKDRGSKMEVVVVAATRGCGTSNWVCYQSKGV